MKRSDFEALIEKAIRLSMTFEHEPANIVRREAVAEKIIRRSKRDGVPPEILLMAALQVTLVLLGGSSVPPVEEDPKRVELVQ